MSSKPLLSSPTNDLRDVRAILAHPTLSTRARLLAITLIMHRNNETGRCDPGVLRLAEQLGADPHTVRRALRELEAADVLRRERRDGFTTQYNLEPLSFLSGVTETEGVTSCQGTPVDSVRGPLPVLSPERTKERTKERANNPKAPKKRTRKATTAPAKPNWVQAAAAAWQAKLGHPNHKQIGAQLKPVVAEHGEDATLAAWSLYLDQQDTTYASPGNFASKAAVWLAGGPKQNGKGHGARVDDAPMTWAGRDLEQEYIDQLNRDMV